MKITKKVDFDVESLKSDKVRKRKSIVDYEKERDIRIFQAKTKVKEKILLEISDKKLIKPLGEKEKTSQMISESKDFSYAREKETENNLLDDYELNHLEYNEAIESDKRSFIKIYWSILKRDHLIIFTFINWDKYNLFYIKIERFFFVILTLMAMNGFLFSDKSIHKLYLNGVKYYFGQQILQIILSIIITHVMEILLCFLSLTDRHIYKIKALAKSESEGNTLFHALKNIKINLIIFFILLLVISMFYWYFISAFCAVYKNTQGIFIIDCMISFIFFSIDPFIVYALIALLRMISLKKKVEPLYKISRIFPIF